MATDNDALGSDFAGVTDLDFSLSDVSGRRALAEAVARRWLTPRGSLIYDPDYGQGLLEYTHVSTDGVDGLRAALESEALKDERVEDVAVDVTLVNEVLTIRGRLVDAEGPFDLTVSYDGVRAALALEE